MRTGRTLSQAVAIGKTLIADVSPESPLLLEVEIENPTGFFATAKVKLPMSRVVVATVATRITVTCVILAVTTRRGACSVSLFCFAFRAHGLRRGWCFLWFVLIRHGKPPL